MAPKTVLITGANRGIGLGIVRELLKTPGIEKIIAGARNVDAANDLQNLAKSDSRLHLIPFDVSNDEILLNSVKQVEDLVGTRGLNLLINNAGVLEDYRTVDPPNRSTVLRCIDVNAVSALLISQHFLPLLQQAASQIQEDEISVSKAAIVNIGSDNCSQTLNVDGFGFDTLLAYSMSKTAMLSFSRSLAADFNTLNIPVLVTTIHPGWVLTEMGGPNAEISVEESAADVVSVLGKLNYSHSGGLFDRHLVSLPF